MATIKQIAPGATEIRIDRLNAVLFAGDGPVAAEIAGGLYHVDVTNLNLKSFRIQDDWICKRFAGSQPVSKTREFFDNILTIYMNPAALDALEGESDHE